MNKLFMLILLFLLQCFSIFAQSGTRHGEELEIELRNRGNDTTWNFTFKTEAQDSIRWHFSRETIYSPRIYTLTTDHTGGQFDLIYPASDDGFDFDWPHGSSHEMACDLYKISETNSGKWFKIDYRDTRYPYHGPTADRTIYYNMGAERFEYDKSGQTYYLNGLTKGIWWFYDSTQANSLFCTKPTDLSIADSSSNPYLTWEHDQDPDEVGAYDYEVYRLVYDGAHPIGKFTKIATVSSKNYLDTDIHIGDANWSTAWYKVRSKVPYGSGTLFSIYSSIVDIDIEGYEKRLVEDRNAKESITNRLFSNHPNPFNPTTTITYSIAQKGQVSLIVYNSLAQEVALLVNGEKSEGEYSVKFDAGNLPSGVYFYKLETDFFSDVKKMVVTK